MAQADIIVGVALILLIAGSLSSIFRAALSPLRGIPGPFLARFTDLWYLRRVWLGHFDQDNIALHEKYGPVVRYGPNRFSFRDTNAGKTIYGLGSKFAKSSWYRTASIPGQWTLFSDRDITRHSQSRRLYQAIYSMTSVVDYEKYVEQCVALLCRRLDQEESAGTAVDMGHWLQCFAFDVIGLATFSQRFGFLDDGVDIGGIIAVLDKQMQYASILGVYSWLHPYIFPVYSYLSGKKGTGRAYVLQFTQERIAEHRTTQEGEKTTKGAGADIADFLTKFLKRHWESPEVFTSRHVTAGCVSNVVAGSDTTAIALSAIVYYLALHPRCVEKLRVELQKLYNERRDERPSRFRDFQNLEYLGAVVKEALRLHPSTGLPLERVVPRGGATISGHYFPEGSIVGINSWVQHRINRIFGHDASEFRPERWLTEDAEQLASMNLYWMPFGLGARTCIGRHISFLMIFRLIPRLVSRYDFEVDPGLEGNRNSWHTENSFFVKPRGFLVTVRRRQVGTPPEDDIPV